MKPRQFKTIEYVYLIENNSNKLFSNGLMILGTLSRYNIGNLRFKFLSESSILHVIFDEGYYHCNSKSLTLLQAFR